jgi:hypothetical protein
MSSSSVLRWDTHGTQRPTLITTAARVRWCRRRRGACTQKASAGGPRGTAGRPVLLASATRALARYFTMTLIDWLQSPSPVFVTPRYRKVIVAPGVSPAMTVFAYSVTGAASQVLPPSMLYCHSYDARRAADGATIFTGPETAPGCASKVRAARTAVFFTLIPALWMKLVLGRLASRAVVEHDGDACLRSSSSKTGTGSCIATRVSSSGLRFDCFANGSFQP